MALGLLAAMATACVADTSTRLSDSRYMRVVEAAWVSLEIEILC